MGEWADVGHARRFGLRGVSHVVYKDVSEDGVGCSRRDGMSLGCAVCPDGGSSRGCLETERTRAMG